MLDVRTFGAIFLGGIVGGLLFANKIGKIRRRHRPKPNRVIEVELSEGINPEDIIITVPRRAKSE